MKQSAESINSLNSDRVGKASLRRGGIRDLEIDAAMGPGGVVVIDELDEDALEVAFVPDEEPVQTLGPHSCYRRDYLRTTVGAPARIFGDDFSLGD